LCELLRGFTRTDQFIEVVAVVVIGGSVACPSCRRVGLPCEHHAGATEARRLKQAHDIGEPPFDPSQFTRCQCLHRTHHRIQRATCSTSDASIPTAMNTPASGGTITRAMLRSRPRSSP